MAWTTLPEAISLRPNKSIGWWLMVAVVFWGGFWWILNSCTVAAKPMPLADGTMPTNSASGRPLKLLVSHGQSDIHHIHWSTISFWFGHAPYLYYKGCPCSPHWCNLSLKQRTVFLVQCDSMSWAFLCDNMVYWKRRAAARFRFCAGTLFVQPIVPSNAEGAPLRAEYLPEVDQKMMQGTCGKGKRSDCKGDSKWIGHFSKVTWQNDSGNGAPTYSFFWLGFWSYDLGIYAEIGMGAHNSHRDLPSHSLRIVSTMV